MKAKGNAITADQNSGRQTAPAGTAAFTRFIAEYFLIMEYKRHSAESELFRILKDLHLSKYISISASRNHDYLYTNSEELDEIIRFANDAINSDRGESIFLPDDDPGDEFARLTNEMIYCKIVNIFLIYLSDISIEIVKSNPKIISSSDTMKIEEIVKHNSIDEIVQSVIERKINDLSYAGVSEISNYMSNRFGVNLFIDESEAEDVRMIIEIRNLYTHNNGIVNSIYKKKNKQTRLEIGQYISATHSLLRESSLKLQKVVMRFDKLAQEKFGIPNRLRERIAEIKEAGIDDPKE